MSQTDPIVLGCITQRFSPASRETTANSLVALMAAVDDAIEADDCEPVWFHLERCGRLQAVMTADVWAAYGERLFQLASEHGFVPERSSNV